MVERKKRRKNKVPEQEQLLFDAEDYGYTVWGIFLRRYVEREVERAGCRVDKA